MRDRNQLKRRSLARRHRRVRKKAFGTVERPRLCVTRSVRHVQAQLVDDASGRSILCVSTLTPQIREQRLRPKCKASKAVGSLLADRAQQLGVTRVVFDRGGYLYHGRVKAVAEGARQQGLEF